MIDSARKQARNAIESLYLDRCTIYRNQEVKEGSITHHDSVLIAEDIPCKLSRLNSKVSGENVSLTTANIKLFLSPEVDVLKGDEVHIIQQGTLGGIQYIAGAPFKYPLSHIEVELSRNEYE